MGTIAISMVGGVALFYLGYGIGLLYKKLFTSTEGKLSDRVKDIVS